MSRFLPLMVFPLSGTLNAQLSGVILTKSLEKSRKVGTLVLSWAVATARICDPHIPYLDFFDNFARNCGKE